MPKRKSTSRIIVERRDLAKGGKVANFPCWATYDEYTDDQTEFLRAVEQYKREACRPFPTLVELLAVMKSLGYAKQAVAPAL